MDPGARWFEHMRRGELAAAWALSAELLRARAGQTCWHLPRHEQWVWDGTLLAGRRVVIHCYHGLGDTIQFIRYLPLIDAAEITVVAQRSLIPLLETMRTGARFVPLTDEGYPRLADEVHVEVMELPFVFRSTLETIPREVPYLFAPRHPDRSEGPGWKGRQAAATRPARDDGRQAAATRPSLPGPSLNARDDGGRIGIVWEGGDWDPRRDVPRTMLEPLADFGELVPLQRGSSPDVDTPLATARVMTTLDLVVTIDSFPAHFAGALGVPVWTLLHAECDWRWMRDRDDSPWYPTMRLFRQQQAGEWAPVVARVREALAQSFAAMRPASPLSAFDVSTIRSSSSR